MTHIAVGTLLLYPCDQRLEVSGVEVLLTEKEFKILELLAKNVGVPVAKGELSKYAFGRPIFAFDQVLTVYISSLKRKLGRLQDGRMMIETVIGKGYKLLQQ
jgi:DNA-binding response OmpR family regulator